MIGSLTGMLQPVSQAVRVPGCPDKRIGLTVTLFVSVTLDVISKPSDTVQLALKMSNVNSPEQQRVPVDLVMATVVVQAAMGLSTEHPPIVAVAISVAVRPFGQALTVTESVSIDGEVKANVLSSLLVKLHVAWRLFSNV